MCLCSSCHTLGQTSLLSFAISLPCLKFILPLSANCLGDYNLSYQIWSPFPSCHQTLDTLPCPDSQNREADIIILSKLYSKLMTIQPLNMVDWGHSEVFYTKSIEVIDGLTFVIHNHTPKEVEFSKPQCSRGHCHLEMWKWVLSWLWRHSTRRTSKTYRFSEMKGLIESQLLMMSYSGTSFLPIFTLEIVSCLSSPLLPSLNWKFLKAGGFYFFLRRVWQIQLDVRTSE